jgi:hypothetical protein
LNTIPKKQEESQPSKETSLKGTFVSVMVLGAFLVVTWVSVFILFMVRQ